MAQALIANCFNRRIVFSIGVPPLKADKRQLRFVSARCFYSLAQRSPASDWLVIDKWAGLRDVAEGNWPVHDRFVILQFMSSCYWCFFERTSFTGISLGFPRHDLLMDNVGVHFI